MIHPYDDFLIAILLTLEHLGFCEQADRDVVGAIKAYTTTAIADFPKPVIAAVNGYARGGCEFALQCDFVIASDRAKFGQPEISLGLIPGAGGSQRLPRVVGRPNASYMLLTGRMINAEQALRMGLVAEVVAGDAPLAAGLRPERQEYQLMFGTADVREGIKALIDKSEPQFHGERSARSLPVPVHARPGSRDRRGGWCRRSGCRQE
jgi:enoyl-CoA hydratase